MVVFQKTMEGNAKPDGDLKVLVQSDGSIIIIGTEKQPWPYDQPVFGSLISTDCLYNELESVYVEKRTPDGNFQWREQLGSYRNVVDGLIDSEDNIVMTGWQFNHNTFDQLLIKIDPDGIVEVENITKAQQFQTKVFPNPGNGQLNIEVQNADFSQLEIRIFNSLGQLIEVVRENEMDNLSTIQVNTRSWQKEMYFIHYVENGQRIKTDNWLKIE